MSIRYLNETANKRHLDDQGHAHLNVPGEFILYPSAVRVFARIDPQSDLATQLLEAPHSASTFYHEYQHFLSFLGTTYGNAELFLWLGVMDKFFDKGGVIEGIAEAGKRLFDLPRPLVTFLRQKPSWASERTIESARLIEFATQILDILHGKRSALVSLTPSGSWPFRGVVKPASDDLLPKQHGVIGPHSGEISEMWVLGSHLIHEGAARTAEYRALHDFLGQGMITEDEFILRDEQAYYQVSRSIVIGWIEAVSWQTPQWEAALWHQLICDLSLMGPADMYRFAGGHTGEPLLEWKEFHPGWRFWDAALAAGELARDMRWDRKNFTREQYLRHANALCEKLGWPTYEELVEVGRRQMEFFFSLSKDTGGFPNSYYRELLRKVWECKAAFPHLFFNVPLGCDDLVTFVEKIGLPRILMTRDFIQLRRTEGDFPLETWQAFHMLHAYSIAKQLLENQRFDDFRCYQQYFDFLCPQSNGRCGKIPDPITPPDCPFMEWLGRFGIKV